MTSSTHPQQASSSAPASSPSPVFYAGPVSKLHLHLQLCHNPTRSSGCGWRKGADVLFFSPSVLSAICDIELEDVFQTKAVSVCTCVYSWYRPDGGGGRGGAPVACSLSQLQGMCFRVWRLSRASATGALGELRRRCRCCCYMCCALLSLSCHCPCSFRESRRPMLPPSSALSQRNAKAYRSVCQNQRCLGDPPRIPAVDQETGKWAVWGSMDGYAEPQLLYDISFLVWGIPSIQDGR